jgi:cytoskeletal protein CcmA (bactofilin family)
MRRHVIATVALAIVAVVVTTAPTLAARRGTSGGDRRISVVGDVTVSSGVTVDGLVATGDGTVRVAGTVTDFVFVGDGEVFVSGRVTRGVVIAHGDAHISGRVGGDVVALSGRVIVTSSGSVGGDVVSRLTPRVARGTVEGAVKRVDLEGIFTGVIIGFLAYLWLATTISIAVLGLVFVGLFPRAADTAAAAGKRVAASFGWGALVGIVGPFVAVLILASIIGIPLGLGLLSGLNILAPIGYVTAALIIGRRFVKGTTTGARLGAFFAGFGILRLIALVPGLGLVAWFVACVYGLGAVSMAAWYGGRRPPHDEIPPPPAEPPIDEPPAAAPPVEAPVTEAASGEHADEPATEEPPRVAWSAGGEPPAEPAEASS